MNPTSIGIRGRLWLPFLLGVSLLVGLLAVLADPTPQVSQAAAPAKSRSLIPAAPAADFEISQAGPDKTFAGEIISYTLLLVNNSLTAMDNITVTDTWRTNILGKDSEDFDDLWNLGPLMTFDGYSASNPALIVTSAYTLNRDLQRGEAIWIISSLPAQSSLEIIFTATTPVILQPAMANYPYEPLISKFRVMGPSTLQNTVSAQIGATEYPANFSAATVMAPLLDVTMDVLGETTDTDEGRVGRMITYTLAVENVSAAERVDTWPASNLFVSVTLPYQLNHAVEDIMASETVTPVYNSGNGFIQWIFPPTFVLTPGMATYVTFTARIPAMLDYNDSKEQNLQITKFNGVIAKADPTLMPLRPASMKSNSSVRVWSPFEKKGVAASGKTSTLVNSPVTYTLTFYNPVDIVTTLALTDLLHSTFVFSHVAGGSPELLNVTEAVSNVVAWRHVVLAPYQVVSVTFVTTPTYATLFNLACNKSLAVTNGVSATSPAFPVPGYEGHDDNKLAKITVQPQIKVSKAAAPTQQFPGEVTTYTIALENQGLSDILQQGIVTDTLPEFFRFITMTADSPISYPLVLTDILVQWTDIPTIPAKTTLKIPFVAEVDGVYPTSYKNNVLIDIPGVMACSYTGASVKVLPPFTAEKKADVTDMVVQGDVFTYQVAIRNISPRSPYTITRFVDKLDTAKTGLVTHDTLISTYAYTPTPSVYLTPSYGTWEHSFPVLFRGFGISAVTSNTKWCDSTFSNKLWASLIQARQSFLFQYLPPFYWVYNGSADGEFTALPHISLYQQVYPNPVAISQPVTIVLTLRDNRVNPVSLAQDVLLRWEVPAGFEFISSDHTPITQTASELVWDGLSVQPGVDTRVVFSMRVPGIRQSGWSKNYSPAAQVISMTDTTLCIPKTTKFVNSVGGASEVPTDGIPGPIPEDVADITFGSALQVNQGIEITKKPTPDEIGPYGAVEYEISVRNLTGSPVSSVVITDILPTYYDSYPWTYLEMVEGPAPDSEAPLVWHLPTLEPQSSTSLVFTTRANNWLGIALNDITGTAPINLITAKNYLTDRPVMVSSGIGFFKEAAPETIYAGDLMTYTITLFNGEAYKLGNMVITDTLPPGFTFDSMIEPGGLAPQGTTTLVWHILGTLKSGSAYVIRFRARTNTEAQGMFTGVYYNEMTASAWNDQNQKSVVIAPTGPTAPVYVHGRPTVAVYKEASVNAILPGQNFSYTIRLYNEADEALTLQVTDTLPVDFALAEALSPTQVITGMAGDQQWVRWEDLAIAPYSWLTLTFNAHVALDAAPGGYYNQVQVQINEFSTPARINLARVEVLIPKKVDAQVSSTNHTQVVRPDEPITYTISYTNAAASEVDFTGITLTVTFLPTACVTLLPGGGWVQSGNQYYKVISGTLASGDSGTAELQVQLIEEAIPPEALSLYYRVEIEYTTAVISQDLNPDNDYDEDNDLIAIGDGVSVGKTAVSSVRAAEEITYTVKLFNNHKSLSYTVRLSDTLPVSFTWEGVVAPSPAPVLQEDERTLVWENIIIKPEELMQISYRARVDLLAPGADAYCNTVRAQASNGNVFPPPVAAQHCVAVISAPRVDVKVTKSDGQPSIQPGETVTYTIIYENLETSETALNTIILTETIAPYSAIQSARWVNTSGTPTDLGDGRYRIEVPVALEPGGVGAAFFAVTLKTSVPTTTAALNNRVEVSHRAPYASIEVNPTNNFNTDVDTVTYTPQDIVATKTANPDALVAGEEIEYRIMLHNPSGSLQQINVVDTLPAGVTFVSAVDPATGVTTAWVGDRQQVIWSGQLIQTFEKELVFRARVARSSAGGFLCNTVQVQRKVGNVYVPQPEVPGLACVNVTPLPAVDIQISKDDGVMWTEAGDMLIYAIHYTNAASSQQPFTVMTLTDTFSPTALVASVVDTGWTSVGSGVYRRVITEPLAPGASGTVYFAVNLQATIPDITELENSVSITYATAVPVYEQNQANNVAADVDVVIPQGVSGILARKFVAPDALLAGGTVTYTIELFNADDVARTADMTDTLPLSFTLASGTPDATSMSAGRQQLIWHGINVPANDQVQLEFTAQVAAAAASGSYCNQLAGRPDIGPVFTYEGACVAVTEVVVPLVDAQVSKSDGVTQFSTGDRLTYTVHYANAASSAATLNQVVLTETIAPAGNVTLLSAGWSPAGSGRYTRTVGTLAPGAFSNVAFVVQVNGAPAAITNTVQIGYPAQGVRETQLTNNTAVDVDTLKGVTPINFKVYLPCVLR